MTITSNDGKSHAWTQLFLYSPVLIAILVMLPRLLTPQFGLFDDGRTLVTAQTITSGTWYTGKDSIEGRFRPIHWLWFSVLYLLDGANPFWFFIGNMLALAFVTWGIIFLVRKAGGSCLQAWLAGAVFVLAGPIPETFFSLKGEVHQSVFLMLALLSMLPYSKSQSRWQKAEAQVRSAMAVLLASFSKETSVVLLPISVTWFALVWFIPGYGKESDRRDRYGAFAFANIMAVIAFFIIRTWVISMQVNTGTYTQRYAIDFGQILQSVVRWGGWLVRDFFWVVPLLLAALLLIASRRKIQSVLLLESFVWMGAWMGIYLPWNFMAEYYMLPFTMGLAVFASALVVEIIPAVRDHGWRRLSSLTALGLSMLFFIGSLFNTLTNARVQLVVDESNARMMTEVARSAAPNSLILVNFQDFTEYVAEMQTQFGALYRRPDLRVEMINPEEIIPDAGGDTFIVAASVHNQPQLTVRMGVVEESQGIWNERLKEFFQANDNWKSMYETMRTFRLSDVNYPRLFCPFIKTRAFCATPAPLVDTRPFTYGWIIYKLEKP